MPDFIILAYIAIMAFYFFQKDDGKTFFIIMALPFIALFSDDYWLWLPVSAALSVVLLIIEGYKAGPTAGGAVVAFFFFSVGAFIVSVIIKTAWVFFSDFRFSTFHLDNPLSYEWPTYVMALYGLAFVLTLITIFRSNKETLELTRIHITAFAFAALPHFCGSFLYGMALSFGLFAVLFLLAVIRKINREQRFLFAYTTLSLIPGSFLLKGIIIAFF